MYSIQKIQPMFFLLLRRVISSTCITERRYHFQMHRNVKHFVTDMNLNPETVLSIRMNIPLCSLRICVLSFPHLVMAMCVNHFWILPVMTEAVLIFFIVMIRLTASLQILKQCPRPMQKREKQSISA